MSLILPTGEYLAIEQVTSSSVTYRLHKDAEQRARYKDQTMDKYEITIQNTVPANVLLSDVVDPEKTIRENLITAGYTALKLRDEFSDSIDA